MIPSDVAMSPYLLTELLILRRLIMIYRISSKRIDIVCGAAELWDTSLPLLLLSQYLLHLALGNRRCCPFNLRVDIFYLSDAALAEVTG